MLDELLSGGLATGAITQVYGASATGKTHFCHLFSVALPKQYKAIYIDTEAGFREQRIQYIANARGLNCVEILDRIQVAEADNTKEQELCSEVAIFIYRNYSKCLSKRTVDRNS